MNFFFFLLRLCLRVNCQENFFIKTHEYTDSIYFTDWMSEMISLIYLCFFSPIVLQALGRYNFKFSLKLF